VPTRKKGAWVSEQILASWRIENVSLFAGTQLLLVVVRHVDYQLQPSPIAYTTAHKSVISVTAFKDVVVCVGIGTNLLFFNVPRLSAQGASN
jgi:uncharacterized membrane protein